MVAPLLRLKHKARALQKLAMLKLLFCAWAANIHESFPSSSMALKGWKAVESVPMMQDTLAFTRRAHSATDAALRLLTGETKNIGC